MTASIVNPRSHAEPPKRTPNKGWTKHAALRNRKFLYSVNINRIDGFGYWATHTVERCPPTPEIWSYWIMQYFQTIGRYWPLARWHCVTEMQLRGVPHLHTIFFIRGQGGVWTGCRSGVPTGDGLSRDGIVIGRDIPAPHQLIDIWLKIASDGRPQVWGQDVKSIDPGRITPVMGYVSKHGIRGVNNAQRNPENMPSSWEGRSCRVWRKGGDWPIEEHVLVHGLTKAQEYQARRRIVRYLASCPPSLQISDEEYFVVRKFWQGFLKCNKATKSRMRAPSAFLPIERQVEIIKSVAPDAWFSHSDTGEIFYTFDQSGMERPEPWVPPAYAQASTDMSDLYDCV